METEFRAWDKESKQWRTDIALRSNGEVFALHNLEYTSISKGAIILDWYTGQKDKNGKKIFKDDIVRAWVDFGPAGEVQKTYAVTIGPFGCNLQEWTFKEKGYLPEVIGDIYSNPELLEAK